MGGSLIYSEISTIMSCDRYKDIKYFIETGTYKGDTTLMAAEHFLEVYTTEIVPLLYEGSKLRAIDKGINNINFLLGDSVELLKKIMPRLDGGAVFFLDAHQSGCDTSNNGKNHVPLFQELEVILDRNIGPSIYIIDDLRLFDKFWDWKGISEKSILDIFSKNGHIVDISFEKNDRYYVLTKRNKEQECSVDKLLLSNKWMADMKHIFPPLVKGDNIERAFYDYIRKNNPKLKRSYINVNWANLYYNKQFAGYPYDSNGLQKDLDGLDSKGKYFAIVQYSSKIQHKLPKNTMYIGNSFGNLPMPLLYDNKDVFSNIEVKTWSQKNILCGFVGGHSHILRSKVKQYVDKFEDYYYFEHTSGSMNYDTDKFISNVIDSKFCLSPRGFGRSSYRFFEVVKLGSVPIYIWDDKNWLPFKNKIDYSRLAIVLNISEIDKLDSIIRAITEEQYDSMISYAKSIMYLYTYDGACKEFIKSINKTITIKCKNGFGDQLIGYACSDVLAHELGAETLLDMSIFDSPNCPITVNSEYKSVNKPDYCMDLSIDCKPGRDKMERNFQTREFWEKINESEDILIDSHTYYLHGLLNNKVGSVSFKNNKEIVKSLHDSLVRLFDTYCNIDYNDLHISNMIKNNNNNTVVLHIRIKDDKYILQNLRKNDWSTVLLNKLEMMFKSVNNHLIENPPGDNYKLLLLSDLNSDDIHEIAFFFIDEIKFIRRNSGRCVKHSSLQKPSKSEWCDIIDDFSCISSAQRCYVTPNSNFSKSALLHSERPLSSSYFLDSNGDITTVDENFMCNSRNI